MPGVTPSVHRESSLLYVYTKRDQGDLTLAQTRVLGSLVREEFK
jgi:hypothetical protein